MNATTKVTRTDGEFRVRLFIDGEYQAGADYFTDDLTDAKGTAKMMVESFDYTDKEDDIAIQEMSDWANRREFEEEI